MTHLLYVARIRALVEWASGCFGSGPNDDLWYEELGWVELDAWRASTVWAADSDRRYDEVRVQ